MSIFHSPLIVTDCLVMYFDAANKNSSTALPTTWPDLISQNNLTFYGSPTYSSSNSGSVSFNSSTSDYYYLGSNIIPWDAGQSFSISLWFKTASNGILLGQTASAPPLGGSAGWVPAIYIDSNGKLRTSCFWGGTDNPPSFSASAVNDNVWHNVVVTYASGFQKSYLDGVIFNTWYKAQNYYSSNYYYYLGAGFGANWNLSTKDYSTGFISTFSIYNKALSDAEITQNFNALRGRYAV